MEPPENVVALVFPSRSGPAGLAVGSMTPEILRHRRVIMAESLAAAEARVWLYRDAIAWIDTELGGK
jgi:hypothetical protein